LARSRCCRGGIVPVTQHRDWIGQLQRNFPELARSTGFAVRVKDGNSMSGVGTSHLPWIHGPRPGTVADEEVSFCLAVHLVDREVECGAPPFKRLSAQGLTTGDDGVKFIAGNRNTLPLHHAQRGWRQEARCDAMLADQRRGPLGVKATPSRGEQRPAVVQGRDRGVEHAPDPCPVRWRPHHLPGRQRESVVSVLETG
jgi:hypothetical protein